LLSPATKLVASITALVVVVSSMVWFSQPGEANAYQNQAEVVRKLLAASPLERALSASEYVRVELSVPGVDFDLGPPLRFAVLQTPDAPISPLVGSKAQNRIYFASDLANLAEIVRQREPDYIVLTKQTNDVWYDALDTVLENQKYEWLKIGNIAAVAGRAE
jgi:hypothetical protein